MFDISITCFCELHVYCINYVFVISMTHLRYFISFVFHQMYIQRNAVNEDNKVVIIITVSISWCAGDASLSPAVLSPVSRCVAVSRRCQVLMTQPISAPGKTRRQSLSKTLSSICCIVFVENVACYKRDSHLLTILQFRIPVTPELLSAWQEINVLHSVRSCISSCYIFEAGVRLLVADVDPSNPGSTAGYIHWSQRVTFLTPLVFHFPWNKHQTYFLLPSLMPGGLTNVYHFY